MAETIQTKRCSHCKEIKELSEFHKNKNTKDKHHLCCKSCRRDYSQQHKIHIARYGQKWYKNNRVKVLQSAKLYREENKSKTKLYHKQYYKTIGGYLRHTWNRMFLRCYNTQVHNYRNYGGRGIKVKFSCFEDFYDYVVKELKIDPRGLTIDRINNDGHYEKGNIRFVSMAENRRNKGHKYKNSN